MVLPAAAAAVGIDDGMGDGMQCSEHPQYYNQRANPGGICALCLQEKLGRLVSSSSPTTTTKCSSPHLFYPSALAAPPYSSDSPSSPPSSSSLRPTVVEATGYDARAGGDGKGSNSSYACNGGHRRASSGNRAGSGGRSRMIPFLYSSHGKKNKSSGSGSSTATTSRTSSTVGRKVVSSTTSSSSLSAISNTASSSSGSSAGNPVFKRSKSVAPRPTGAYLDGCRAGGAITEDPDKLDSPRKKSFWSFLHLSSSQQHTHHQSSASPCRSATNAAKRRGAEGGGGSKDTNGSSTTTSSSAAATTYIRDIKLLPQPPQLPAISTAPASASGIRSGGTKPPEDAKTPREYPPVIASGAAAATATVRAEDPEGSPGSGSQASASFGRKVARSRSVGCGSRSFSGDFLERISTVGFGDCALRRVESQREAKPGKAGSHRHHRPARGEEDLQELPPQRVVRCGGIFGGFYSSSSSSYWLSDDLGGGNGGAGRISTAAPGEGGGDSGTPHSRRSWAWAAFASPMRAFRPSSSSSHKQQASAVASVNGVTRATGRSTTATPCAGGAAVLAVKG